GVMLFGMNRVPAWAHIAATALVAAGTSLSAFWILALNSWMQTPAGHVLDGNQWIAADWLAVIFNPSFPYRFTHMMIASGLTAAFVVAGLSAWRLLKEPADAMAARTLRVGVLVAAVLAPVQAVVGDFHGLNTLEHQPAKIAAMEGIWHTEKGVPLVLFAIPNEKTRTNDWAIEIPYGASLILKHDPKAELKGLDAFGADHPPVAPVFFSFRIMVGIGVLMIAASWYAAWATRRGAAAPRWLLWTLAGFTFSGWAATLAGWMVTEIGRQPWIVHGVMRTAEAVGDITGAQLGVSLTGYALTYATMFVAYMVVLTHLAGAGAESAAAKPLPGASPVGAAAD
ncbi:MAG TPA: cytochrome ubiquinol oxidase subunit I, partial [Usitatibacteraceae bacterium]|nr:cytochrome ubiquinol oxidase subunit I [Usitatibacteraceae bacterium]